MHMTCLSLAYLHPTPWYAYDSHRSMPYGFGTRLSFYVLAAVPFS